MSPVSIIIPAYNQGRYITTTLESALAQTYADVEIIVVDDGSTDDTAQRIVPYADRVKLIRQANKGLSAARNTGLAASQGEYVLFLDSDDLLLPSALEKLVQVLDQTAIHGLAYCAWQQIHAENDAVLAEVHPGYSGHIVKELLLRKFFFFGSSTLIRRRVLEQVGPFDESLPWGDDADMWLRIGLAGWSFGYLDEALMQYRVHPTSMTASVGQHQIDGWQASLRKFYADPYLPEDVRNLEKEAWAILYYETAGRFLRAGDLTGGKRMLEAALQANGLPNTDWFLNWLAGTALDPRTADPQAFIARVFDQLPSGLESLRRLRWQAQGRFHTAALFAAHQARDHAAVRRHLWPVLRHEPRHVTNRGLMKIVALALFTQGRRGPT